MPFGSTHTDARNNYEHFWPSSLLKFDEFYENVNNADGPKENVLLAIGSRDELKMYGLDTDGD